MVLISCRKISPTISRHASGSRPLSRSTLWRRLVRLLHSYSPWMRPSRVPSRRKMHRRCHPAVWAEAWDDRSKFFFWDSQHIMFLTILSHFFFLKLYLTTLTSRRHVSIMINTAERERKKTSWERRASAEWKSFPRTWIRFLGISTEIRRKSQRSLVALRRNLLSRCYSQIATHHHHIQQPPKKINHAHFIAGQDDHSHSELAWSTTVIFCRNSPTICFFHFSVHPRPRSNFWIIICIIIKKKKGKLRKSSLL